jgi:hypothetical protein
MHDPLVILGLVALALAFATVLDARVTQLERKLVELRGQPPRPGEFLPKIFGRLIGGTALLAAVLLMVATFRDLYARFSS